MKDHLSTRTRILLAWQTETEILPRMTVLERARTTDIHEFRHMVDAGFLRRDGNEYGLTPAGIDRRDHFRDVHHLIHG
jgi:hypothetical protein